MKTIAQKGVDVAATTNVRKKSLVREYAEAIVVALLLALFIRTFVVQAFKIPSGSMIPTLLVGDHLLVTKFLYGIKNPVNGTTWVPVSSPKREDIIVFRYPLDPSKDYIKRVIGLPGDTIEIVNKKIYINKKPFQDSHGVYLDPSVYPASVQPRDNFGPIIVPKDKLFVMGDNRDNSYDSRFWRFVDMKDVLGKAFIIYWSWDKENFKPRWDRFGDLLY